MPRSSLPLKHPAGDKHRRASLFIRSLLGAGGLSLFGPCGKKQDSGLDGPLAGSALAHGQVNHQNNQESPAWKEAIRATAAIRNHPQGPPRTEKRQQQLTQDRCAGRDSTLAWVQDASSRPLAAILHGALVPSGKGHRSREVHLPTERWSGSTNLSG